MTTNRWTKDQLKLAFYLYCQMPFGKMHRSNPEVVELAGLIGRTPSAVAMKLVNFASLDPAITATGRSGLDNTSALDREIWNDFHADWEGLAIECSALRGKLLSPAGKPKPAELDADELVGLDDFSGETRRVATEQRIKQHFFRRAVLSIYRGRCCMSGVSDPRLLQASHIVPWSMDKANRLNPSNGLCLSVLHDRAFDRGMIDVTAELTIVVSDRLKSSTDEFVQRTLGTLNGRTIELPERFLPSKEFLARHMNEVFENS